MIILLVLPVLAQVVMRTPEHGSPPSKVMTPMAAYDSINNRFLKLGGKSYETGSTTLIIEEFDIETSYWKKVSVQSSFIPPSLELGAVTMRDHELLLFFGTRESGISSEVFIFNTKTLSWSTAVLKGDQVPGRMKFAYCKYEKDGSTYFAIYGGLTNHGIDPNLYIINIQTLEGKIMPNNGESPGGKITIPIEYYQGKIYLFGYTVHSNDNSHNQTNLYAYDLTEEKWSVIEDQGNEKPEMRMAHSLIAYENELYVVYGYNLDTVTQYYSVWKFSLFSYIWINLGEFEDTYATSCEYIKVGTILYLIGGRTKFILKNSIISVDLSENPLVFSQVTLDMNWPERRRNHISLMIEDDMVIYGGYNNGKYYYDMWKYNIGKKIWTDINMMGDIPSARINVACAQIAGNAFAIFGGKDESNIYSDLYYYYDYDFKWTLAEVVGTIPTPRHSASMCYYNYKYYIIGGQNSFRAFDEIWLFDYATSSYSLLSTSASTKLINPLVQSHCHIKKTTELIIYVIGGSTFEKSPNSNVVKIHLSNTGTKINKIDYKFENINDFKFGLSETSAIFIDTTAYLFFGSFWDQEVVSYIAVVNLELGSYIKKQLPDEIFLFGHTAVHYGNATYVFGGELSMGGFKYYNTESNLLYIITELGEGFSCSPGTQGEKCEACNKGTYWKDGVCVKCSPGTFSDSVAAISVEQCIPCANGFYASTEGSTYCLECSVNLDYCPLGSEKPHSYFVSPSSSSSQPLSYKGKTSLISDISTNMWCALESFCLIFLLIIFLFRHRLYMKLKAFDCFASHHSKEFNTPIVYKKTNFGGLFTILFALTVTISVSIGFISFSYDNINEIKALVPVITMENTIKAKEMFVDVQFYMYPGLCDESSSEYITISTYGFKFINKIESYLKDQNTCHVQIEFIDFMLKNAEAYIYIAMTDRVSYSSGIGVNLTVSSSIPDEYSSIFTVISPESGDYVFRGRKPSIFPYTLTPSVFTSESSEWASSETGYHVSLDNSVEYGSFSTQKTIISEINLMVTLKLIKSTTGMSTSRSIKYSWIMFLSMLLGSVFGLMSSFTVIMGILEDAYKKYHTRFINKNLRRVRIQLKNLGYQFAKNRIKKFNKVVPMLYPEITNI